jgi:hypothetical protein
MMTEKATLHQLIEDLPESEPVAAERFLAYLRDMTDPRAPRPADGPMGR